MTQRGELLYEGKAKRVFAVEDPELVIIEFKDDATAFNGVKRASISDKGRINLAISAYLFDEVAASGVDSHMVKVLSDTEMLCRRVEIVPVEVIVRNFVAGSLARRYGREEGPELDQPLVELFYKSDELDDPLMHEDIALAFGWAKAWEMAYMREAALEVNAALQRFWGTLDIDLVDFKIEFGRAGGRLFLADEITPDGSRLWEKGTRRKLDKDVFRRDLGDLSDTYRELYARVFGRKLAEA